MNRTRKEFSFNTSDKNDLQLPLALKLASHYCAADSKFRYLFLKIGNLQQLGLIF